AAEPRGVLRIDFAQRRLNRELPTEQVLDLLQRRVRRAFEVAEVVGKWIWIAFPEPQDQQTTAELSQLGFHWNSRRKVWQHPFGVFKGEPVDPRSKYQSFHPADQRAARREAHALLEEAKHAVEVAIEKKDAAGREVLS